MMRLSTLFWIGLGIALIFGVFHLKREVHSLEEELTRLSRDILAEQEAIQVLQAEWSYLNRPARLRELAQRHLDLGPMKPTQIGRLADLPARPAEVKDPAANAPMAAAQRPGTTAKTPAATAAKSGRNAGPAGGAAVAAGHEQRGTR